MKEKLLELFEESWYSRLGEYLLSKEFLKIGVTINQLRENKTIYPSSDKIFRIFKEIPYEKVSLCLIGQDVYHDGSACGHAFCNCEALKLSPSLRIIYKEIEQEYPELTDRFEMPLGGLDMGDLSYLVKQGVFLLNTALTVEKSKPGSHMDLWKPFTLKVIETLNKIEWLPWLLLGKKAQELVPLINPKHSIICGLHPAAEIYKPGCGFIGSGIFRKVNFELDKHKQKEILW
jgi:uracil-DNA glycosylase